MTANTYGDAEFYFAKVNAIAENSPLPTDAVILRTILETGTAEVCTCLSVSFPI